MMTINLEKLHQSYAEQQRKIAFMTDYDGMLDLNKAIEKKNNLDYVDFLEEKKIITIDEKTRLKQMINALEDDYILAKEILVNLSKKVLGINSNRNQE